MPLKERRTTSYPKEILLRDIEDEKVKITRKEAAEIAASIGNLEETLIYLPPRIGRKKRKEIISSALENYFSQRNFSGGSSFIKEAVDSLCRGESLEEIIKRKTGEIKEILSQNSQELTALGFDWELFSEEKGLSLGLIDKEVRLVLFPNGTIHKTGKKTHQDSGEIKPEEYLEYFSLASETINDVKGILSER